VADERCPCFNPIVRGGFRFSAASLAGRIAVGYALLASLATGLAFALRDGVPWQYDEPWLKLEPLTSLGASAGLGIALALLVIAGTRLSVARFSWAQRLHLELRPIAQGLALSQIVLIAGFSSLGEELLFRGLLQPWLGVLPTAVLFGVCHQIPGHSRWVWVCWATFVGLAFGAIFAATGSLVGPLLAHAVINAVNLAFLRDHDPMARRRPDRTQPTETVDPAGRA
jgi:membrane protease YdiL (CAAX protease family)